MSRYVKTKELTHDAIMDADKDLFYRAVKSVVWYPVEISTCSASLHVFRKAVGLSSASVVSFRRATGVTSLTVVSFIIEAEDS